MNNHEKIRLINEIVQPYYNFNLEDMYGDKGSSVYPNIEDLTCLFFKKQIFNIKTNEEQTMIEKIQNLNIGFVETAKIQAIGHYIVVQFDT